MSPLRVFVLDPVTMEVLRELTEADVIHWAHTLMCMHAAADHILRYGGQTGIEVINMIMDTIPLPDFEEALALLDTNAPRGLVIKQE